MKNISKNLLLTPFISMLLVFAPVKADINVVTSIKPLHSLTSYIMEGVGEPGLIIDGVTSPHNFQIKPSHAKMLQKADLVIWVGEDLESFLPTALKSIPKNSVVFPLLEQSGLKKLKFREKNIFDDHDGHEDEHEGHEDEDDHGHKDDDHDDDHDGHEDEHEGHDDDHKDAHAHAHGEFDPHIWLDPENAKEMVKIIRDELIKIDPDGQRQYSVNTAGATLELDNLINSVEKELSKDISYIVFHDAYQYFENRFGVIPAGALTLNPDVLPGAKQIADIQDVINDKGIKCIFSEPQYTPKRIETIGNVMKISTGVMDPLGAYIDAGPSMYSDLINGIANSIKDCH